MVAKVIDKNSFYQAIKICCPVLKEILSIKSDELYNVCKTRQEPIQLAN